MEHTEANPVPERKRKLIESTIGLLLTQGYSGTSVDQICAAAGVTKGSFFHYFGSKEEICRAAMDAWSDGWEAILRDAGLDAIPDPLDRLERLFDTMAIAYLQEGMPSGCVVGTVAQEQAGSNRSLGDPCEAHLDRWTSNIRRMLEEARDAHAPARPFDPSGVADFMLAIVQGTLLVAKTRQNRDIVVNNVQRLRAYVLGHFGRE